MRFDLANLAGKDVVVREVATSRSRKKMSAKRAAKVVFEEDSEDEEEEDEDEDEDEDSDEEELQPVEESGALAANHVLNEEHGQLVVCTKKGLTAKDCVGRRCTMNWKKLGVYHGTVMSYEHKVSTKNRHGYIISFWVHFDEDDTHSLYSSRIPIPNLDPLLDDA